MKLKLTWLLTLFMAFVMQFSFAQEKMVTGTVTTESDGLPLPGASVIVKGTTKGAQTDFDGKYTIGVNSGDVLVISYVGMEPVELTIGASNVYDVVLKEGNSLDEVVVVGYSTTTKQAFAGTATSVSTKDIENKNFANVTQSLAGEASGVQVINTTGQPGTVSAIRIRGFGSLSGNRSPLYVVDGVPITAAQTLNAINPADIKSTVILKDATATAIYGSRGANGVVLITTKTGSSTESYIEVDLKTGINTQLIDRYDVVRNQEEYVGYVWEATRNQQMILNGLSMADANAYASANLFSNAPTGTIPERYNMWNAPGNQLIDPATGLFNSGISRKYTPENFQDLLIRDGYRHEANVRFGGGDEKTRYFLSAGFLDDEGYIRNSSYKRYNARLNVSSQVKDWLKVGASLTYLYAESRDATTLGGASAAFEFIDKTPTLYPIFVRDADGNKVRDELLGGFVPDYGAISTPGLPGRPASDGVSPYGNIIYDINGSDRNEFIGNFNLDFTLAEGLTFENAFSYQYRGNIAKTMQNQFYGPGVGAGGTLAQTNTTNETLNLLNLLRYKKDFGNHSLEVLAAHESNEFSFKYIFANKETASLPFATDLSQYIVSPAQPGGYEEGRSLESFFGQVNYDFDDRYYFTGSIRRDGSSVFANNKWDTFYSLGGAWILTNESWLNSNFLRYLKLKASYGLAGDEGGVAVVQGYYSGLNQFDVNNLDGAFSVSLRGDLQNPDLSWERKKQYQVGLEFTLGDIVDGNIDYYVNDTENLFFNRPGVLSTGSSNELLNDGELRNTGLEFDFTFHVLRKENVNMDFAINGAHYTNEMLSLYDGAPNDFINFGSRGLENGRSIYDFYMREYAGVDPADGFPMWYQYYDDANNNNILDAGEELVDNEFTEDDGTTTGIPDHSLTPYLNSFGETANIKRRITKNYNEATEKFIEGKSVIPDLQGGFRLSGNVHNFTYGLQFTYQFGGYAYDNNYREFFERGFNTASGSLHTDIRDRWQQPGDITNVPRLANGSIAQEVGESDRFIIKSDYFALNSVNVGYNIPSKFLDKSGIDNINIYFSADNLFISTARKGYNPTVREAGFTARNIYAPLSSFTIGTRFKF